MTKAAKREDPFVRHPQWFAEATARITKSPAILVCYYILHASWKARSLTFTMPNGWLEERGVSRKTKRRVLLELEAAGLIMVDRSNHRSPKVTLMTL